MEGAPHADPAFASNSNSHDPETVTQITGMFTSPQNFIVNGGTFTNITDNHPAAPSVPSDFRTITLGDIDLQHELGSNLGTVNRRPRFRRVYAAKVEGRQAKLAVSIYEGDDAEEQWQQCVVNHRSARHPNILQIYGIASSWGVHAILFHGSTSFASHLVAWA
ncbi:hypothetical protein C8F04DRAFT_1122881 [Mycena alexandri]|uniref:Protein kinase domain-containing protein n=1 Tax=Mycena alexandri TaxID=1745969 RepID=A0AAD6WVY1_9AGAR|nr:hypothetical protein C8F04DRAFT_1122881 [Mycena alexandri]